MTNAKEQVEELMNELLPFAERMLREHGGFNPFGGYLAKSRKIVHVGAMPESKEARQTEKAAMLIDAFKSLARNGQALAFGVATDVLLPSDGGKHDAIQISLEHIDGYCADVFFWYERKDGGVVDIVKTTAQRRDRTFFK